MSAALLLSLLLGCHGEADPGTGWPQPDSGSGSESEHFSDPTLSLNAEIESIAQLSWTQDTDAQVWVVARFDDDDGGVSSPPASLAAGDQQALLLGLPYETDFTWALMADQGEGAEQVASGAGRTGDLPDGLPLPELITYEPDSAEPTLRYLLSSINQNSGGWESGSYWRFILDRRGRMVWAMVTPDQHWTVFSRVSQSGRDLLWDEATWWSDFDNGTESKIHRWKIDGTEVSVTDTPGLHHPFTELPDETLVWGSALAGYTEDLVSLAPGSDEIRTIWRCRDFQPKVGDEGVCQSNTVSYDDRTDHFLFSMFTNSTLVEIDRATGETLWWAGSVADGYDFEPDDASFYWQHGPYYTEAGTLLMSARVSRTIKETVIREYTVDPDTRQLTEVWSNGRGEGIFADSAGDAVRLKGGNTLHNLGSAGLFKEVTNDGEVVWRLDWSGDRLIGRAEPLDDLYAFAP